MAADPSVISATGRAGPIRRSRLVAGIALHFLVPSYALVLVGDAALGHAPHAWAAWLPHALGLGGWFLAAYGGATVLASGVAALADRRRLPAANASPGLATALSAARGRFGASADVQIDRLATLAVSDESGPIAQDVLRLLTASAAAPGDDPALQAQTAQALATLADALEQAQQDKAGSAQDQALVMARYIDLKYRPENSAQDTL